MMRWLCPQHGATIPRAITRHEMSQSLRNFANTFFLVS